MYSIHVYIGDEFNLRVTFTPANTTIIKREWTSSDESVMTVDSNGKCTAVGAGTVTITHGATVWSAEYTGGLRTRWDPLPEDFYITVEKIPSTVKKPEQPQIKTLKSGKKKIKIIWDMVQYAQGYEVQLSTSKKFKKN